MIAVRPVAEEDRTADDAARGGTGPRRGDQCGMRSAAHHDERRRSGPGDADRKAVFAARFRAHKGPGPSGRGL